MTEAKFKCNSCGREWTIELPEYWQIGMECFNPSHPERGHYNYYAELVQTGIEPSGEPIRTPGEIQMIECTCDAVGHYIEFTNWKEIEKDLPDLTVVK